MEDEREDLTPSFGAEAEERRDESSISSDLIRGHINTIILRTLWSGDKYGYEIIDEIERKSHGQYSIKQPTLYSALKRLESQGYVTAYWGGASNGGRRRYFQLTELGKESYLKNQEEWAYSRSVIDSLISDQDPEAPKEEPSNTLDDASEAEIAADEITQETAEENFAAKEPVTEEVVTDSLREESETAPSVQPTEETEETSDDSGPVEIASESFDTAENEFTADAAAESPLKPAEPQVYEIQTEPVTESDKPQEPEIAAKESEPVQSEQPEQPVRRVVMTGKSSHSGRIHANYISLLRGEVPKDAEEEEEASVPYNVYEEPPTREQSSDYRNAIPNQQLQSTINTLYNNAQDTYDPAMDADYPEELYDDPNDLTGIKVSGNLEFYDILEHAEYDGIKVYTSGGYKKKDIAAPVAVPTSFYNKGLTLFKSALGVFLVALVEFLLVLLTKSASGVSLGYCFTILALDIAMLLTFTLLMFSGFGKNVRRKRGDKSCIVTACILFAIFALIVAAVAVGSSAPMTSMGEIMKNIGIPLIVGLNIPLFSIFFYLFTNQKPKQ